MVRNTAAATKTTSSGFACLECGHRFRTMRAVEKATSAGCPKCGGADIDLTDAAAASPR